MALTIREWRREDLPAMLEIWNEVVREGRAFPQLDELDEKSGAEFFAGQSRCAVAGNDAGEICGLYILHPNNVGRCGHIANASFAARADLRGRGTGRSLVEDCLKSARELGFRLLQFNAVVRSNARAVRLYESLGFRRIGVVPGGFLNRDGDYEDIILFYHEL